MKENKVYKKLNHRLNLNLIVFGALVGALTAFSIKLFQFLIGSLSEIRISFINLYSGTYYFPIIVFAVLIVFSLIIAAMLKDEPSVGGSGIADVKTYVKEPKKINHRKRFFYKYFASIMALGSGLTVGRVGPSVHFGAMIAIELGERYKMKRESKIYLTLAGIAAGLASIFHAPLAGIVFVLEVMTDDASENVLTVLLSSVASAYFFTSLFTGGVSFPLQKLEYLPLSYYHLLFILIIFSVVFAKIFSSLLLRTFSIMKKIPLKDEYLPMIPFLLTGVLYFVNENYVGLKLDFLLNLQDNGILKIILFYFLIKLFLTLLTFGSRVPGGLFFPVIFLGAVAGILVFKSSEFIFALDPVYLPNFIALGIVAFLTAVYKTPLMATVLIIELTGSFMHLAPVLIVALFVQMGTDYLDLDPVDNLLIRYKDYFEKE